MNPILAKKIAEAKARTAALLAGEVLPSSVDISQAKPVNPLVNTTETLIQATIKQYGFNPYQTENGLILNDQQRLGVDWFGLQGKSGCLIGPAGTGKTTSMRAIIRAMIMSNRIPKLTGTHKFLKEGIPGIYGGSFTRIATRNLRDNTPDDIKPNIHTLHRLLEFEPTWITVLDKETGKEKEIRIFKPTRDKYRTLSPTLVVIIIDEASMVGTELHAKLMDAIGCDNVQIIYIGDIAQLPPVMDSSILGYKMLELPVVELTEVYRHAGRIVNLANHIRTGNTVPDTKDCLSYIANLRRLPRAIVDKAAEQWNGEEDGSKVTFQFWKNRLEGENGQLRALRNLADFDAKTGSRGFFIKEIDSGNYDPLKHMILIPYNKAVGTIELNRFIANYLGKKREAVVHEIISGYEKHYLAVGDKLFFDREESVVSKINKNALYIGKVPQVASVTLDRWGHDQAGKQQTSVEDEMQSIDALLKSINVDDSDEERKNQASHVIYVKKLADIEEFGYEQAKEYSMQTASEVNGIIMGYALTIHKSQGSQWKKVYCVFHNSHNRNLQRELLYTAITRAQKELFIICEPETFIQGVFSQHIKGNTLQEKAEFFKGKIESDKQKQEIMKGVS